MGTWTSVGEGIWVNVYTLNGNALHTTAVSIGDGKLAVVSPATDVSPAAYEELDTHGTVAALVSPGAYHHMGLPAWSARYPKAELFGPGPAAAHIKKQHPSLPPLRDLVALSAKLPSDVEAFEVDGCEQPDALIVVRRPDGTTWLTNEILTNWEDWPKSLLFKMMFKITGSGPGLNVNTMSLLFIKGKKPLVRSFFEAKLASHPPTRMIPCHGAVIEDPALKDRLAEVLARRL